jgi:hypothetical protein
MALTKAERYKRNYHLINNKYHDHTLSQRARSWGEKRLREELGIIIKPDEKHIIPMLKETTGRDKTTGARHLRKYKFAISEGLTPEQANKVVRYSDKKIVETAKYEFTNSKPRQFRRIRDRQDLWSRWSRHLEPFPPMIESLARKQNRSKSLVDGTRLDDYAKYGYIWAYYYYVLEKSPDEIDQLVMPPKHDVYGMYYAVEVVAT